VENELRCEDGSYNYNEREIRDCIEKASSEGRPLIRSLYRSSKGHVNNGSSGDRFKETGVVGLNPLVLICHLLYQYIQVIRTARNKAVHLYRRPNDREVEYPKGRPWYEFQIDKDGAAMFCPVPSARRRRLRKQIVVLKTFWDISSNLRERRLWQIISDNWPESELFTQDKVSK
jgi:hypothetical protein